jgi:ABC-type phosphate transport system permease subunit
MTFVATVILGFFGIGFILPWIAAYDAYLLGQKLQRGEAIGQNENGLEFLNAIFKD